MKITIEHYDTKYSIETNYDDINFENYMNLIESVSKSIWGDDIFNEYFKQQ